MPKTVLVALLLICAGTYVVLFTMWNPEAVTVYGWRLGEDYWQKLPVAYITLLGVAIGIVVMSFAGLFSWAAMRGRLKHAGSQIGKAKVVIEQQRKRIAELEGSVADLRKAEAAAREAAAEQTAPDEQASSPAAPSAVGVRPDGDDEVI